MQDVRETEEFPLQRTDIPGEANATLLRQIHPNREKIVLKQRAMTNKDKIIERLEKLKRMRENGEDGERTNAAALIEEIMRRHGISEQDLEEEEDEPFWLQVPDRMHYKLFLQMMALTGGRNVRIAYLPDMPEEKQRQIRADWKFLLRAGEEINVVGFTKKSVFMEGMAKYMMYKEDFRKNTDRFFYAYLHRNNLLLDSTEEREMSDDEIEDIMASLMMSRNIRRAEVLRQLEEGGVQ